VSEILNYDNLVAGAFPIITDAVVLGASQTVARGDLLRLAMTPAADTGDGSVAVTPGENWVRADAAADIFSVYAIAAEAKTTGAAETATILVYRTGEFNENRVGLGGESTPDQNRDVLACKGIFLKKSQKA
jgi:hypothetical protein